MIKSYKTTEELTEIFKEATTAMADTFRRKNHDYGNSFFESLDKRGLVAALVRMEDKMNRLDSLSKQEAMVADENLIDTLLDLANYSIMTSMWLGNRVHTIKKGEA